MPSAVSFRYARALVDVVAGPGADLAARDPRKIADHLAQFDALLQQNPELRILFGTPAVVAEKKKNVLAQIVPLLGLDPLAGNFLNVVIDHDRMNLLGEIREAFESLLDDRLGIAVAEVTTARPLGESERQQLAAALHARTGKQVRMNFSLDPSLIGGIIARLGSTIYDGSVRGQLHRLRATLAGD